MAKSSRHPGHPLEALWIRGHTHHKTLLHLCHNACDHLAGEATGYTAPPMPRFPRGEEYALLFDHNDNLVEDSPSQAITKRCLQQAIDKLTDSHPDKLNHAPTFISFLDTPKSTNKLWHQVICGFHGDGLATFLTQLRVNRVPTGTALNRFHRDILASCHTCRAPDTLRHRLLECPGRLNLARQLPTDLAQLFFKHSHYPWPDRPPPSMAHTREIIGRNWPNSEITLREEKASPVGPKPDEPLSKTSYLYPDGSLNIKLFRILNPFTPEDIETAEALKPIDRNPTPSLTKPTKSKHRSDKATLVTVAHPSGDTSLPKHTIPVTGFTHLWHRFTSLHPDLTPSRFHSELYDLLSRESEGSKRTTGIEVNFRNFWCTPPALLRILRDLFSLHSERFCNPLNFSPLFQKATTANAEDKFWGFDFDAMLADWAANFGYLNPEFTDDLMLACINKASQAATQTTDHPVRNIAVIPFHKDCPQTFAKLSEYHHTQKVLITFQPGSRKILKVRYP